MLKCGAMYGHFIQTNTYNKLPMSSCSHHYSYCDFQMYKSWLFRVGRLSKWAYIIRRREWKGRARCRITKMRKEKEAKVRRLRREGWKKWTWYEQNEEMMGEKEQYSMRRKGSMNKMRREGWEGCKESEKNRRVWRMRGMIRMSRMRRVVETGK